MRPVLLLLVLAGCGNPISNEVFYEEAEFLAALPTSDRFHAPASFLDVVTTDPVLFSATGRASDLRALYAPMTVCADALFATEPDVRGDTFRTWDVVPVVVVTETGSFEWWVRSTVTAVDGTAWTWTIEGARNRIGPWWELASGRHEASDAGFAVWHLDVLGDLVDVPTVAYVEHNYARQEDGSYALDTRLFTDPLAADPIQYWAAQGESFFSWSDLFRVTEDDAAWPGVAVAVQTPQGGRADGFVWVGAAQTQVTFGTCWNGSNSPVWIGGDSQITASGDPGACVMGSLLEEP